MRMVQKILSFVIVGITLTLSTGFLGMGGEKPEEGVKALITAIENNDHVAFMERVPKEYWVRLAEVYRGDHENPSYAWLKDLFVKGDAFKQVRRLNADRATQSYFMMDALLKTITNTVASGDFANYCRKYKSSTLPFDPNVLSKLTYGDMGEGKQEGIIAAVATMPDGQEGVLGLAFIDKKWRIVSLAGNKKAAMDRAEAARKVEEDMLARIAARKKGAELYLQEMGPQLKQLQTFANEKKWPEVAKTTYEMSGPRYFNMYHVNTKAEYNSKAFWNLVSLGIYENIKLEKEAQKFIDSTMKGIEESVSFGIFLQHYATMATVEVVWKNDNTMLLKQYVPTEGRSTVDAYKNSYTKWINFDTNDAGSSFFYTILLKEGDKWIGKGSALAQYDPFKFGKNYARVTYYPFEKDNTIVTVSLEEYMITLAKKFSELYIKAQTQVANEAKWTKEIENIIAELNKAIVNNSPEVFEKYLALPMVIRDDGDINKTAIAMAKYGKNNEDVEKFLDGIRNGTSTFSLKDVDSFFVDELEVVMQRRGKETFYFFERKKGDEPWKLARINTVGELIRPKDWDAKLADLVKKYEVQFALNDSVQVVFTALQKAYTANDPKVFEQYIDLPSFLRDNGNLENTAQAMAVNAKSNADVKAFLEQVSTGKWQKKTPLKDGFAKISSMAVQPLEAIVSLPNQHLLLVRKTEKDAWKIVRYASNATSLKRPENWHADVATRAKVIEEEIAKEEARKQKVLAEMQKKMQEVSANIVKAITEKNAPLAEKYIESSIDILTVFLAIQDELRGSLRAKLAPLHSIQSSFRNSVKTGTPSSKYVTPIWDIEAWKKATFAFLDGKEQCVLATLPTATTNTYALFVPFNNSYKLIVPPSTDKRYFEKNGTMLAEAWMQLLSGYKLDEPRQELMFMVETLRSKNGKKFLEFINVPNLVSWKNLQDRASGLEEQIHNELFDEQKYTAQAESIAKSVSEKGTFTVGTLEITPRKLEKSNLHILTPQMLMLEMNDNNLFFVKKDNNFILQGMVGKLSATQRGELRQRFPDREKELANGKKATLRTVAAQTVSNAVLDLLHVTGGSYEVFKTEKGTVQLRVQAIVQNTAKQAVKPTKFMMFFEDAKGQGWLPWVTKVTSENIKPGATQTFEWEFFPNEKEIYLLQQAEAGKMHFMVRTSEATMNKDTYKRFSSMIDPKQLPDGMWQLGQFAPVKPMLQWRSAEDKVQKAMWDGMKKSKTSVTAHTGHLNQLTKAAASAEAKTQMPVQVEAKAETKPDVKAGTKSEAKPETKSEDKPETAAPAKAEAKAETPVQAEVKPVQAEVKTAPIAITGAQPTAPAPKKPGKAVIVPITTDSMSLTAFTSDSKPDSNIRVLAHGKSPLVGVRVESLGGSNASWKTQSVKTKAIGVLAVMQDGKALNVNDAAFSVDVSSPVTLDLVMQDNGSIGNAKIRLRVIFFHKDGSRTYSIIEK